MKFGDKLKGARKAKRLKQDELGKLVGVSSRTIQNYETGNIYPKSRHMYHKLAEILDVDVNYLLSEDEESATEAQNKYGYKGKRDASLLIDQISWLFAGGAIPEEDKDTIMKKIQEAYWDAKERKRNIHAQKVS